MFFAMTVFVMDRRVLNAKQMDIELLLKLSNQSLNLEKYYQRMSVPDK